MNVPPSLLEKTFVDHPRDIVLLRRTIREWAEDVIAPVVKELDSMDHEESIVKAKEIIKRSSEIRLLSLIVPEEYGGMGGLSYSGANAVEVLAYYDAGMATSIGAVWLGLLPVYIAGLMDEGRSWRRWFKPFVEAEERGDPQIWAFAITEPEAGSDYERVEPGVDPSKLSFTTTAKKDPSGGYVLNGRKVFISNGPIASHVTVFAVENPKKPFETMLCLVVERERGFRVETVFDKMGHRSSPTGELVFEDVWVPEENLLCPQGLGWDVVEITLAFSRAPVGAIGLGIAKRAFDEAVRYSFERIQGGRRIVEHQLVKYKLALMLERIAAAETLIYRAARLIEEKFPPPMLESSIAKAFGADTAVNVALEAIQVLGGYGYMRDMGVEKLLRDAKLIQIYEGTNEINRLTAIEEYLKS
ncbi:MAG: acyl-CoA/acyl-ACP dehydrogenase [Desulfurococcales archaeon]|nr:acyl-CoA/acyl-ACP dehydrogenase [Desulfurococcales archaeon]